MNVCSCSRRKNGKGETDAEKFMEEGGGCAWFGEGGNSDLVICPLPAVDVWVRVSPVAPLPCNARRSVGGVVRCCKQVVGLRV